MSETPAAGDEYNVHDLSPEQRRVLEEVYQAMSEEGRWPSFEVVDHRADVKGVEDVPDIMQSLAPTHLQGFAPGTTPALQQPISLTLEGVAAVAGWNETARTDLDVFIATVEDAVRISDRTVPPDAPRFDALAYLTSMYPHGVDLALVQRLHALWSASAGHLWHGMSAANGPNWSLVLNRQVLRSYRNVHDVPALVSVERQRRERQLRCIQSAETASPPPAGPHRPDSPSPTWVDLLPTDFRAALGSLLDRPGSEAIAAGWIELADLVHRKSGADLDGAALINKAFGKNPLVHLAPVGSETGRNQHEGYTDLLRGLARMRNVHAHRGRPKDISELHVAAMVLTMGECYSRLAELPDLSNADSPSQTGEATGTRASE